VGDGIPQVLINAEIGKVEASTVLYDFSLRNAQKSSVSGSPSSADKVDSSILNCSGKSAMTSPPRNETRSMSTGVTLPEKYARI